MEAEKLFTIQELKSVEYYYDLDGNLVEENDQIPSVYVVRCKLVENVWEDQMDFETLDEAKKFYDECVEREKKIEKLYICVADYEGGSFHIGDTMTAQEWKEWAMGMNDFDEWSEEDQETFKKLSPEEAVDYVADMWQIEIVPFDAENKEHIELRKEWEEE